jgi:uncharacterized protein
MISIEELNEIKQIRKTNLFNEEKEYLQYIFLNAVSKFPEIIFKGGTCLRICYGLERASEDLDFSTSLPLGKIDEIVLKCMKDFELLGINHKIFSKREFEGNIRYEIRFEGPLFSGKSHSTNTLKLDFNKQKVFYIKTKIIQKLFPDVPFFSIRVLDEKEILAEKIRSLCNRSEPRDLYDLWILINKGSEVDKNLIQKKLKQEESNIRKIKLPKEDEYKNRLKELVLVLPEYGQVKKEVEDFLRALENSN